MVNFQSIRKMKTNPKTFQEERDPLKAPFYWDKWWLKQEKLKKKFRGEIFCESVFISRTKKVIGN